MKAALSHAAGFIAPSDGLQPEPHVCIECGAALESWQASRCESCIAASLVTMRRSSQRWTETPDNFVKFWRNVEARRARRRANNEQWRVWASTPPNQAEGVNFCDSAEMEEEIPFDGEIPSTAIKADAVTNWQDSADAAGVGSAPRRPANHIMLNVDRGVEAARRGDYTAAMQYFNEARLMCQDMAAGRDTAWLTQ